MLTILLSELNPSTLTLDAVAAITESEKDVSIIILGEITIDQEIAYRLLNYGLIQIKFSSRSKYLGLLSIVFKLVIHFRKSKTKKIYASGRTAAFLGMVSGFLARVPKRIFTRHHGSENYRFRKRSGVLIDRITNSFSTKIIAVSQICKETLIFKDRCDSQKIIVIYNSIESKNFSTKSRHFNTEVSATTQISEEPITVGVIGRCVPGKGIGIALMAFAHFLRDVPFAKLKLIGDGNLSSVDYFNSLAQIPSSNIERILGTQNIENEYQNFDIFLHLPEYEDFESFGLVYLEAMAAGVPSIFTVSGILHEITVPGFVRVVEAQNIEETYHAILDLYNKRPVSVQSDLKFLTSTFGIQRMKDMYLKAFSS